MEQWRTICHHYAQNQSQLIPWLSVLEAFGEAECPRGQRLYPEDFGFIDIFAQSVGEVTSLHISIVEAVSTEVDVPQAQMFARRFVSVIDILQQLAPNEPVAKMLLIGLVHRLQEILQANRDLALRVRAVVDFYYSQTAVLFHRTNQPKIGFPSLQNLLSVAKWRLVDEGIFYAHIKGNTDQGPVNINVLRIRNRRIWTRDFRNLEGDFAAQLRSLGCSIGVSGGFFL